MEKLFSREQVAMHIVGAYVSMCKEVLYHTDKEYKRQKAIKIKLSGHEHPCRVPKRFITLSDLEKTAIFYGYSNKEKEEIFNETIMRGGFTTYITNKGEKYYGIEI